MPTIATIETKCPCCEGEIIITDFDPEDHEVIIECELCGAELEEWIFDAAAGTVQMIAPADSGEEEEDDEEEDEEEEDEES